MENTALVISYLVFLVLYLLFSAAGIYHLWRFGYSGDLSKFIIFTYSIISIIIIVASFVFLGFNFFGG
ncbi:MAG: hypothetical protein NTW50_01840 [Candidatus Berkelbacteria bacterium]|nr:hypothetical protein [Candidatus Berkelbacteria bacterium]